MQTLFYNRDGTLYKELYTVNIDRISKKNGGTISSTGFQSILGKYASFHEGVHYDSVTNRFCLGIVSSMGYEDGKYSYRIQDIFRDLERGDLSGYETLSGTFNTVISRIITQYKATNGGIDVIQSYTLSGTAPSGTYYYTGKKNCYEAFIELMSQLPANYRYWYQFLNEKVSGAIDIVVAESFGSKSLYTYPNLASSSSNRFITSLSYELSRESLANDIYYFNSAGTYLGNVNDPTSISLYGRKVKELRFSTNDGSETKKAQQHLDKYKNPLPTVNSISVNSLGIYNTLELGDSIIINSEGNKDNTFTYPFFLEDIEWYAGSSNYNLIIGDIIYNNYRILSK